MHEALSVVPNMKPSMGVHTSHPSGEKVKAIRAYIAEFEACLDCKGYTLKMRWKLNKVAKGEKQLEYIVREK